MIHHIRGMALGAYRRLIDTTVTDEGAEAAIRAALQYAVQVDETRSDGERRLRAPPKRGAPWSRCYLLIAPDTGDVIGVQPASPTRAPRTSPHGRAADAPPAQNAMIQIRAHAHEKRELQDAAETVGETLSGFVLSAALDRARGGK